MTVAVTAGTTYHIQVAGWNSTEAANILLSWTFVPAIRAEIEAFGPGATISPVVANAATIAWTVPYGSDLATLAPTFTLSPGATCTVGGLTVNSGDPADLSSPVDYTVTSSDSAIINVYTVTVTVAPYVVVAPVAVTAQSNYGPRPPVRAIDGSGMTPNSPVMPSSTCATGSGDDTMWLSDNTKSTWITFDLGSVKILSGFHLWNYNEVNLSNRGVNTAGIYVGTTMPTNGSSYASGGPAWGTLAESFTFTQAPGANGYLGEDYTFATPVTGRYIQIYVTGGFAGADAYTGISEIRFYESTTAAIMASFGPGATIGSVVANAADISWPVPFGSDLATLAPTFTLSPGATCDKASGSTQDFTIPVHYIVQASDFATSGTTTDYTVTARVANALVWKLTGGGDWDLATTDNWLLPDSTPTTFATGDEVTFNNSVGGTITIAPGMEPLSTTVSATSGTYTFSGGPLPDGFAHQGR